MNDLFKRSTVDSIVSNARIMVHAVVTDASDLESRANARLAEIDLAAHVTLEVGALRREIYSAISALRCDMYKSEMRKTIWTAAMMLVAVLVTTFIAAYIRQSSTVAVAPEPGAAEHDSGQ
jgi:hypothetical protein